MYVYESHMGGLFTSDEPLEWNDLYCEECGDSDQEIGFVPDGDLNALWDLIRPAHLCCLGCEKDDYCKEECNLVEHSHLDYDLRYCMQFLSEHTNRQDRVYLVCRNASNGRIFVKFTGKGKDFGEKCVLPSSFCLNDVLEEKVVATLIPVYFEVKQTPKRVATKVLKNGRISVWECVVEPDEDYASEGISWYYNDGWYGWKDILSEKISVEDVLNMR